MIHQDLEYQDSVLRLNRGEIDILDSLWSVDDVDTEQNEVTYKIRPLLYHLGFNMNDSLFGTGEDTPVGKEGNGGLHLRKAVMYALNRTRIKELSYGDGAVVVNSPVSPALEYWYNPVPYDYNLEKAWLELELAGYVRPVDQTTSDGTEFRTTFLLVAMVVLARTRSRRRSR